MSCVLILSLFTACGGSVPSFEENGTSSFSLKGHNGALTASVLDIHICEQPESLAAEKMDTETPLLLESGELNPALIYENEEPVSLLFIQQSYKNTSDTDVELSLLSNQLFSIGSDLQNRSEHPTATAVYLDLSGDFHSLDQDKQFWLVNLPKGETVELTIGYAVPQALISKSFEYHLSPFGSTDAKGATASLRFKL